MLLKTVLLLAVCSLAVGGLLRPRWPGRIVGGQPAKEGELPYQVLLNSNGGRCGGSIFTQNTVITAAHCTDGQNAANINVRAGSLYASNGGVVVGVSKIIQHPSYNPRTVDYDVSILKLASPLSFNPNIQPIRLASTNPADDTQCIVSGWGKIKEGGVVSEILLKTTVPIVNQSTCKQWLSITDRMICAGRPEGGKDSCQGDSGGPLMCNNLLHGVVSWGYGCARPNYPGVYASVANLRSWILENVNQ